MKFHIFNHRLQLGSPKYRCSISLFYLQYRWNRYYICAQRVSRNKKIYIYYIYIYIRLAEITDESIGKRLYHEIQALLQNQYPAKGQRGNMLAKRTEKKRRDESRVRDEVLASTISALSCTSEFSRVKFKSRGYFLHDA